MSAWSNSIKRVYNGGKNVLNTFISNWECHLDFPDGFYNIPSFPSGNIVKMISYLSSHRNRTKNISPWIIGLVSMTGHWNDYEMDFKEDSTSKNFPNEYIFLPFPLRETTNTSRLVDVEQLWLTETRSPAFAISFTWVQLLRARVSWELGIKHELILKIKIPALRSLSWTPLKLANFDFDLSSTILILLFIIKDQARRVCGG